MIKFTLVGDPIAKARHRTTQVNGFSKAYDPQCTQKKDFQWLLLAEIRKGPWNPLCFPSDSAIWLDLDFYLPIPKSWSKAKRTRFEANPNDHEFYHISKPDLDNLVKFFLDCGNKIIYKDDCQVVQCSSTKQYGTLPRTEVVINILPRN